MKYIKKKICPNGCSKGFSTTAHVVQEWEVDETGNFKGVLQDCLEVTHPPDYDNIWTCMECGAEAETVKMPDTAAQTIPLRIQFSGGLETFFEANLGPIPEGYAVVSGKCRVHLRAYEKILSQLERNLRCFACECDFVPADDEIREWAEKLMKNHGPAATGHVMEHYMVLEDGYLKKRRRYMGAYLKEDALMTRKEVIDYVGGAEELTNRMDKLRTNLSELLGIDVVWRHVIPGEEYHGAYILPVREGILWLPYQALQDDAEQIDLAHAELLDAAAASALANEFKAYSDDCLSVLTDIVSQYK